MEYPNFKNKVVSLSSNEDNFNHDLIDPHFEEIAGRIFLIGEIPRESTDSGWNANKIGAIAWDSVNEFVIFDSHEDYKTATEISENHKDEKDKKNT
jgi:hypothetical protein